MVVNFQPPCNPSTFISMEEFPATRILISYGGRVGGESKTYYATEVTPSRNGFFKIVPYTGGSIEINELFIVEMEPLKMVKLATNTLAWANYHQEKFSTHITIEYFAIGEEDTAEFQHGGVRTPKNKQFRTLIATDILDTKI